MQSTPIPCTKDRRPHRVLSRITVAITLASAPDLLGAPSVSGNAAAAGSPAIAVVGGTNASPVESAVLVGREGSRTDALAFFQRLVERYRSLHRYSEEAEIEQVTEDPATDAPPIRTLARVRAAVDDQRLTVESSSLSEQIVERMGPAKEGASDADLWMLPHLRLRFDEKPLETLRPAVRTPFRPSELDRVRVDDRELVRVELLSGETGAPDARFSLYVDPDRMLVERVEGDEWLPGGLRHHTTVRIDAQEVHESRPMTAEPSDLDALQDAGDPDDQDKERPDEVEITPSAPAGASSAAMLSGPLG